MLFITNHIVVAHVARQIVVAQMAKFVVNKFGGLRPRLSRMESPATVALNTDLSRGTIAPFRQPLVMCNTQGANYAFSHNCVIYTSKNPCARIAKHDNSCCYLVGTNLTGMEYPSIFKLTGNTSLCVNADDIGWVRLGVPEPSFPIGFTVPPINTAVTSVGSPNLHENIELEVRDYVYTFVDCFGNEGPPSKPSEDVGTFPISSPATLNFGPFDQLDEWNICGIRVYRLMSGVTDENTLQEPEYMFVAELDISGQSNGYTFSFVDNVPINLLGESLSTRHHYPPPPSLSSIQETEEGHYVGHTCDRVWFSEKFNPSAWPCSLNFEEKIREIRAVGNQLFVITEGHPYVVNISAGSAPDEDCYCCRDVYKIPDKFPLVSDNRGVASTPTGVIFPSVDGLVRISGNSYTLITHTEIPERLWPEFHPHTIKSVAHNGEFYGFGLTSFLYDYSDGTYADGDVGAGSRLIKLSWSPNYAFEDEQGRLLYLYPNGVYVHQSHNEYELFVYQTRLIHMKEPRNWSVGRVIFEDVRSVSTDKPIKFEILDINENVKFSTNVTSNKPFRLPGSTRLEDMYLRVSGISEISEISLATSMRDMYS